MKLFLTKHCLSNGIEEVDGEISKVVPSLITWGDNWESANGEGKNWHRDMDSAVKRAELVRLKKITSLNKQIKKLQQLKFTS